MSQEFTDIINKLIDIIENSEQYKNYLHQQELAKNDPELIEKINEIRRLNFKLQTEKNTDAAYNEQEILENRFEELSADKRVYDFIQSETEFIRIYQEVNKKVLDRIQFI